MTVERLDAAGWTRVTADLDSAADPYLSPAYHDLHAGPGSPAAWRVRSGTSQLFVPGVCEAIGDGGWDVATCNGYGGPLATPEADPADREALWAAWRQDLVAGGGVAAFFRLHPLLDNRRWLPANALVRLDRHTVYVPTPDPLAVWRSASSRHRNMVRKARKNGTTIVWNESADWQAAATLYADHAERLDAPAHLRFGPAYFAGLQQAPWASLAACHDQAGLAAMAIFLFGGRWAHYHLACRRPDTANHLGNALIQAGLERACDLGLAGCHLGGGRSPDPGDSLLRFKLSIGGGLIPFYTAGMILDEAGYAARIAAWRRRHGQDPTWFLGYRQPANTCRPIRRPLED